MKKNPNYFQFLDTSNDFLCWLAHTKASQTTQRKLHQQSMELINREILKGKSIVRRIVG